MLLALLQWHVPSFQRSHDNAIVLTFPDPKCDYECLLQRAEGALWSLTKNWESLGMVLVSLR